MDRQTDGQTDGLTNGQQHIAHYSIYAVTH